jgi:hypothetical protein
MHLFFQHPDNQDYLGRGLEQIVTDQKTPVRHHSKTSVALCTTLHK